MGKRLRGSWRDLFATVGNFRIAQVFAGSRGGIDDNRRQDLGDGHGRGNGEGSSGIAGWGRKRERFQGHGDTCLG